MQSFSGWNYLRLPSDRWKWDDRGEVITLNYGETVIFRSELILVLRALSVHGLPSLTTILEAITIFRVYLNRATVVEHSGLSQAEFDAIREKVHSIKHACKEVGVSMDAIVATILEDWAHHRISLQRSEEVLGILEYGLGDNLEPMETPRGSRTIEDSLVWKLFRDIDKDQLLTRLRTGLDELPEAPEEIDLPECQQVHRLLSQLVDVEEFAMLVSLTKRLMVAASLPRAITEDEDLPLGGASDITNRGPLDRLLVSELAQDNLTLAVRVAMNEAMYLRRESPPSNSNQHRHILLDTTIASWGIPRLLITAAALAVVSVSDKRSKFTVFRRQQAGIIESNVLTREGLLDHLSSLDTSLHLTDVLDVFAEKIAERESSLQPLIVTTNDAIEDDSFRLALRESALNSLLVIAISREGHWCLWNISERGFKQVRQLQFDVHDISEQPTPLLEEPDQGDLPLIFGMKDFPLRFSPKKINPCRMWFVADVGVFEVTDDGCLYFFGSRDHGGRLLAKGLASSEVIWFSRSLVDNKVLAVIGMQFVAIEPLLGEVSISLLEINEGVCNFADNNGVLFAVADRCVYVYSLPDGRFIERFNLPSSIERAGGRIFRDDRSWYVLAFDGSKANLAEFGKHNDKSGNRARLIENRIRESFVSISSSGTVFDYATNKQKSFGRRMTFEPVYQCPQGREYALPAIPDSWIVYDLADGSISVLSGQPIKKTWNERELRRRIRMRSLRSRFNGIGVSDDGHLVLEARKQASFRVFATPGCLQLSQWDGSISLRKGFSPFKQHELGRVKMFVATWEDGSQAFLDARGMLHLRSSNPLLHEVTLVLNMEQLSGWCSDGTYFGDPYFFLQHDAGPQGCRSPMGIITDVLTPFVGSLM